MSMARIGELAAQESRRNPQATGREFARHLAAAAEAGMGEPGHAAGGVRPARSTCSRWT